MTRWTILYNNKHVKSHLISCDSMYSHDVVLAFGHKWEGHGTKSSSMWEHKKVATISIGQLFRLRDTILKQHEVVQLYIHAHKLTHIHKNLHTDRHNTHNADRQTNKILKYDTLYVTKVIPTLKSYRALKHQVQNTSQRRWKPICYVPLTN